MIMATLLERPTELYGTRECQYYLGSFVKVLPSYR